MNRDQKIEGGSCLSLYRTVYRFEDLGEDALLDQRQCREPTKVSAEVERTLVAYIDQSPRDLGWQRTTWTLELLAVQLTHDTGVKLSPSHVRNVLLANQVRRGRPRPGLRIPVRGRRRILNEIDRLVTTANGDEEVFYLDEADIDLNPRIGTTYMRRGKLRRPHAWDEREAVRRRCFERQERQGRPRRGGAEELRALIALVDALRRAYRRARRIHLVLDNFIIHRSRRTLRHLSRLGGRIVLHFLPPYSPESNVIERFRKQLHDHVTRNHTHRDIESLMNAVDIFLRDVQPFPGTQVSLYARAA